MKSKLTVSYGLALLVSLVLLSCSTPKDITYFQDMQADSVGIALAARHEITVQPKDKISIVVSTQDAKLTAMFNLVTVTNRIGSQGSSRSGGGGASSGNGDVSLYHVDSQGDIQFPVLGKLHVADLTREQIATLVTTELQTRQLVKDPIVIVDFANLTFSMLGDVSSPGRYAIDRDDLNIIDAISMAGDLAITGNRRNIKVYRQEEGRQVTYTLDLTSGQQVYASPAFYLRQNDVVYVEPNKMHARSSTVNGNSTSSISFWMSAASFLMSIITFLTR